MRALRREQDCRPPGAERPRANRPRHAHERKRDLRRRAEGVGVRRAVADEPPRGPQRPRRAAGDDGAAARGGARLAARRCDARAAGVGADRAARAAAVPARRAARRDDRVHAALDLRTDSGARHERPLALRDVRAGAGPQAPSRRRARSRHAPRTTEVAHHLGVPGGVAHPRLQRRHVPRGRPPDRVLHRPAPGRSQPLRDGALPPLRDRPTSAAARAAHVAD